MAVLEATNIENGTKPSLIATTTAPDWIYDAAFSPYESSLAVLATAHNEVVPMRYRKTAQGTSLFLGKAVSPSRPMLYASHVSFISEDTVLVAGGTVFGDIVVWKYHFSGQSGHDNVADFDKASHTMLYVLRGHEGSIYGVDISPEIIIKNFDGTNDGKQSKVRLLVSCSDDRTIRIWDISSHTVPHASTEARGSLETGFKAAERYDTVLQPVSLTAEAEGEVTPVAVAMGHVSRIWGVKFAVKVGIKMSVSQSQQINSSSSDNSLSLYSFGEDSTAQRWRLRVGAAAQSLQGTLKHEHTYALHNGKHLWARAVSVHSDGNGVSIATGGGDGKINLITERSTPQKHDEDGNNTPTAQAEDPEAGTKLLTIEVPDLLQSMSTSSSSSLSDKGAREIISRFDFLLQDAMLAITSLGRLFIGSLGDTTHWDEVSVPEDTASDLKLCYVLRRVGPSSAVIGTTNGHVFLFHHHNHRLTKVTSLPGRIVEINCLSNTASATQNSQSTTIEEHGPTELLVHLHGSSSSRYLALDNSGKVLYEQDVNGLDKRFVAVSAAKVGDVLFVGSRHGFISVVEKNTTDQTWQAIHDFRTPSMDAVTAIVPLPAKEGDPSLPSPYILVTSRDGKYRIYDIERTNDNIKLHLVHETSPPLGPMIEGAWFAAGKNPQLILYGFRSKDFVIWNESTREELATVDCGGAHRTFRLSHDVSEPGRYRFAYTRTSKLCVYSQAGFVHQSLKTGTHGREVRALSYNKRYIASGAEDTSIRIWEYVLGGDHEADSQPELQYLASMKAHVTGLQKLHWFEDDYLFSSAGNEEFFVWRVRSLASSAYGGLAVVCEGVFTDKSPVGDLRIMDFDVTRSAQRDGHGQLIISLAFSNSTIKMYHYQERKGFKLMSQGMYTGACITQLCHLGSIESDASMLTASTDGHLAIWSTKLVPDIVQNLRLQSATQLHQSCIKSLDMVKRKTGYKILTGGDDNAIGYTEVAERTQSCGTILCQFVTRGIVRHAHTAAINGVVLLDSNEDSDKGHLLGASVSNDQRIKLWRIPMNNSQRVELASTMCSGVADPGDVALISQGLPYRILVGGVGVEVWSVVE